MCSASFRHGMTIETAGTGCSWMFLTGDPEDGVCNRGSDEAGGSRSPVVILREEQILVTAVLGENRRQSQDVGKSQPSTGGNQLFVRQHFPGRKRSRLDFVRCPAECQENAPGAVLFAHIDQPASNSVVTRKAPALLLVELRGVRVGRWPVRVWMRGKPDVPVAVSSD